MPTLYLLPAPSRIGYPQPYWGNMGKGDAPRYFGSHIEALTYAQRHGYALAVVPG